MASEHVTSKMTGTYGTHTYGVMSMQLFRICVNCKIECFYIEKVQFFLIPGKDKWRINRKIIICFLYGNSAIAESTLRKSEVDFFYLEV